VSCTHGQDPTKPTSTPDGVEQQQVISNSKIEIRTSFYLPIIKIYAHSPILKNE